METKITEINYKTVRKNAVHTTSCYKLHRRQKMPAYNRVRFTGGLRLYRGFRLTDVFDSSESMNMDISTSWPFVTCFKNAIKTNEKIFHLQFEGESTALAFCAKLLHCLAGN